MVHEVGRLGADRKRGGLRERRRERRRRGRTGSLRIGDSSLAAEQLSRGALPSGATASMSVDEAFVELRQPQRFPRTAEGATNAQSQDRWPVRSTDPTLVMSERSGIEIDYCRRAAACGWTEASSTRSSSARPRAATPQPAHARGSAWGHRQPQQHYGHGYRKPYKRRSCVSRARSCGKTNHIQWLTFAPARSSARMVSKTSSWTSTESLEIVGVGIDHAGIMGLEPPA